MPRKINHYRRILSQNVTSLDQVLPGQIITFRYNSPKRYDPSPLVFFIHNDKSNKLVHGINLNYLYEADVQNIFSKMSKFVNIEMEYNSEDESYTRIDINKNSKSKAGINGDKLYEQFIKPKVMSLPRTKNCYRTYKPNKMTAIRSVNYQFDVIEKNIRNAYSVSKNKLTTKELFENVKQQQIEVGTDNIQVKNQNQVRKELGD